jgi:hypothetical protein
MALASFRTSFSPRDRGSDSIAEKKVRFFKHLSYPILDPQARHTIEFSLIIGDENEALTPSMACNHLVVGADRRTGFG